MLREVNKIQELFSIASKESDALKINLPNHLKFETNFFQNDFYFNLLKNNDELFIELDEDKELEISGVGIVNVLVKKDINFKINLIKESCVGIRIIVNEGVTLNLFENSDAEHLFKVSQIYLKENSNLKLGNIILNSRLNQTSVFLERNSTSVLKLAYVGDKIENFIKTESIHIGENSTSEIFVNGATVNGAKVLCDGLVRIEKNCFNSSGHQNLRGVLLDDKSSILSEPILEILNNNVKCSHGCTISQISDEINFYMQTRGLNREEIIDLIVKGYFIEIYDFLNLELKEKLFIL